MWRARHPAGPHVQTSWQLPYGKAVNLRSAAGEGSAEISVVAAMIVRSLPSIGPPGSTRKIHWTTHLAVYNFYSTKSSSLREHAPKSFGNTPTKIPLISMTTLWASFGLVGQGLWELIVLACSLAHIEAMA